jgi:RNase P/RNase MRP subunit p29
MADVYISTVGATLIGLFSMTVVAETSPPGTSGIEGTIVVSPIRPGPIRKDEERSVAPVRNAHFEIKAGDATVKTFTTDGEGRFQVALPPGHYVIVREGAPARIGRWQFEADVVAGQMTKVNWTADSGMR